MLLKIGETIRRGVARAGPRLPPNLQLEGLPPLVDTMRTEDIETQVQGPPPLMDIMMTEDTETQVQGPPLLVDTMTTEDTETQVQGPPPLLDTMTTEDTGSKLQGPHMDSMMIGGTMTGHQILTVDTGKYTSNYCLENKFSTLLLLLNPKLKIRNFRKTAFFNITF